MGSLMLLGPRWGALWRTLVCALSLVLLSPAALAQASAQAKALAAQLGQGINFGNMLDSPREGDWGLALRDEFVALVGQGTPIRHVRLPVRWSNHASLDAQARIDPAFLRRVSAALDALLARGVTVILDAHHYRQLDGDALDPGEVAVDPAVVETRLVNIWRQLAQHFGAYPSRLLFEPYNEPHGRLEGRWNGLLAQLVAVIREHDPGRVLVVGPTQWYGAHALKDLVLPADPHLILTVHHYEPFEFTHQGAPWVQRPIPVGQTCCSVAQRLRMSQLLDLAVAEARRRGYPLYLGEFGAYEAAPAADRVRYLRLMRELLRERQLPWAVWQLTTGFGLYDPERQQWRADLREALFGPWPTASASRFAASHNVSRQETR